MHLSRLTFLSVALLLSTGGCRLLEDDSSGLVLVPSVSSSTLEVGDTIRVNTTVTNVSSESIEIDGNSCNGHFEIVDSKGVVVGPVEGRGCFAIFIPVRLAPGQSHVFEGHYTGVSFTELADPFPGSNVYVPQGTYSVRARVGVPALARFVWGRSVRLVVNNPTGLLPH